MSAANVDLGKKPTVIRHAVGRVETHPLLLMGGFTFLPLGLAGVLVGATTVPTVNEPDQRQLGYVALGAGVGLTVLGALMLYFGRTDVQPGSTTQWTLDDGAEDVRPENTNALLVW